MIETKRPQNTVYTSVMNIDGRETQFNSLTYENDRGMVTVAEDFEKNEIIIGFEVERKSDRTRRESLTFSKKASVALALMLINKIPEKEFRQLEREIIIEAKALGA